MIMKAVFEAYKMALLKTAIYEEVVGMEIHPLLLLLTIKMITAKGMRNG